MPVASTTYPGAAPFSSDDEGPSTSGSPCLKQLQLIDEINNDRASVSPFLNSVASSSSSADSASASNFNNEQGATIDISYNVVNIYNETLVSAIRQLYQLLLKADEIFSVVSGECQEIATRSEKLSGRLQELGIVAERLCQEKAIVAKPSTLRRYSSIRCHYASTYERETNLFLPESRCQQLENIYQSCGKIMVSIENGCCSPIPQQEDSGKEQPDQVNSHKTVPIYENREAQTTESLKRLKRPSCLSWVVANETQLPTPEEKVASQLKKCKPVLIEVETSGQSLKRLSQVRRTTGIFPSRKIPDMPMDTVPESSTADNTRIRPTTTVAHHNEASKTGTMVRENGNEPLPKVYDYEAKKKQREATRWRRNTVYTDSTNGRTGQNENHYGHYERFHAANNDLNDDGTQTEGGGFNGGGNAWIKTLPPKSSESRSLASQLSHFLSLRRPKKNKPPKDNNDLADATQQQTLSSSAGADELKARKQKVSPPPLPQRAPQQPSIFNISRPVKRTSFLASSSTKYSTTSTGGSGGLQQVKTHRNGAGTSSNNLRASSQESQETVVVRNRAESSSHPDPEYGTVSGTRPARGLKNFLMRSLSLRLSRRQSKLQDEGVYENYVPSMANGNIGPHLAHITTNLQPQQSSGGSGRQLPPHFRAPITKNSQVIQVAVRMRKRNTDSNSSASSSPSTQNSFNSASKPPLPNQTLPVQCGTPQRFVENNPRRVQGRQGSVNYRPSSQVSVGSNLSLEFARSNTNGDYFQGYQLEYPDECITASPMVHRSHATVNHQQSLRSQYGQVMKSPPESLRPLGFASHHGGNFYSEADVDDYSISNSSAFSCDQDGFYTTMHKDSGIYMPYLRRCKQAMKPRAEAARFPQCYNIGNSSGENSGTLSICSTLTTPSPSIQPSPPSIDMVEEEEPVLDLSPHSDEVFLGEDSTLDLTTKSAMASDNTSKDYSPELDAMTENYNETGNVNSNGMQYQPVITSKVVRIAGETIPEEELDEWLLQKFQEEKSQSLHCALPSSQEKLTISSKEAGSIKSGSFDSDSSFSRKTVRFCEQEKTDF